MDRTTLGDRIKEYERGYELRVRYNDFLIVRLDGHKFSNLTRNFTKPFDKRFSDAMDSVTQKLFKRYQVKFAYTQSDEITLVFPPQYEIEEKHLTVGELSWLDFSYIDNVYLKVDNNIGRIIKYDKQNNIVYFHYRNIPDAIDLNKIDGYIITQRVIKDNRMYASRTQKIASLFASYATKHFTMGGEFDCRVFGVPSANEAFNSVYFRMLDAKKNAILTFGQSVMSHSEMNGLNTYEIPLICEHVYDADFDKIDDRFKYGKFFVKSKVELVDEKGESFIRSEINEYCRILGFNKTNVNIICGV